MSGKKRGVNDDMVRTHDSRIYFEEYGDGESLLLLPGFSRARKICGAAGRPIDQLPRSR